ncbi:MAG: hypothetical protein AAFV01_04225 [Bacteroidota bacterium]
MTVKELRRELELFDDDDLVVLQRDPEGNGFSRLDSAYLGAYAEYQYGRGEVGLVELTPEAQANGFDEEDVVDGPRAVVLVPTC